MFRYSVPDACLKTDKKQIGFNTQQDRGDDDNDDEDNVNTSLDWGMFVFAIFNKKDTWNYNFPQQDIVNMWKTHHLSKVL